MFHRILGRKDHARVCFTSVSGHRTRWATLLLCAISEYPCGTENPIRLQMTTELANGANIPGTHGTVGLLARGLTLVQPGTYATRARPIGAASGGLL